MLNRREVSAAALMCLVAPLARSQSPSQAMDLARLRTTSEEAARAVKKRFSDKSAEYSKSQQLYTLAQAELDGVIAFIRRAIISGDEAMLKTDPTLPAAIERVKTTASEFLRYADRALKRGESKNLGAVVATAAAIVAVALDVIKGVGATADEIKKLSEFRRQRADAVAADLAWTAWSKL